MNSSADWVKVTKLELPESSQLITYGKSKIKQIKNRVRNPFWSDVLKSLIQLKIGYHPIPTEMLTEPIWNSDLTKFKTSCIKQWDLQGLRFIGDLFNPENGNIYTREEIKRQYRISMTFLCYETLIRSLPNELTNSALNTAFERPNIPNSLKFFYTGAEP